MLPEVEKLLLVQNRDQKIRSIEKELAGIPLEEEDIKERLEADRKNVETAKLSAQEVEVAIKNVELDVDTRKDSITKLKVQQFETKKNEEFRRMGQEIERYEGEIVELEDKELELMEQLDGRKKVLSDARGELAKNEQSVEEDLEDLKELRKNLNSDKEKELQEREKIASTVDSDLLYNYDRIFKAKNGIAVVGLVNEVCEGCHMKVIKSTVIEVKAEKAVAHCENCGRILYWWTDDSIGKNRGEY